MDSTLKQRLIGGAVLAALAVIFLPMLLKGPDIKAPDAAEVPLSMPALPDQQFETRELPLGTLDTRAPSGGVLGMDTAQPTATTAQALPSAGESSQPSEPTTVSPTAVMKPDVPVVTSPTTPPSATLVPVVPPSATIAGGNYAVTIGSFSNIENANALVAKLRAARLPVTSEKIELNGKSTWRVRVGPYADRAAAEAARLQATSIAGNSVKVVALDAPASRVTATAPPTPAAVPPMGAGAVKPMATSTSGFAVQLAAPSVEADAIALRDRARAMGLSSFVQRVDTESGVRFRVRVGPVADRAAAETLRDSVNQKLGLTGIVVANP